MEYVDGFIFVFVRFSNIHVHHNLITVECFIELNAASRLRLSENRMDQYEVLLNCAIIYSIANAHSSN